MYKARAWCSASRAFKSTTGARFSPIGNMHRRHHSAAVEKAGDELCSFRALMHRILAWHACAALLRARPAPRMASWLVRAPLCGPQVRAASAGRQGYDTGGPGAVRWLPVTRRPDRQMRRSASKRIVGPDGRFGGDPRQRGRFSREFSPAPAADNPSASRADGGLRPGACMPVARMRPIRTLRPWGAILLAKPAEPPVGSRGAREAALAVEAGSPPGISPLAPRYFARVTRCTGSRRRRSPDP